MKKTVIALALTAALSTHVWSATVVDDDRQQCPNATHASLRQALSDAKSGETITVCPGTYPGGLVIDTPGLTLLGTPPPILSRQANASREVVIQGSLDKIPGILVKADNVTIQHVTVHASGGTGIETMEVSSPSVTDSLILEPAGRGINFEKTVDAHAQGNSIKLSGGAAIRVKSSRRALLQENLLSGSQRRPGIAVRKSHNNVVQGNTVIGHAEGGISLQKSSGNLVLGNRMIENGANPKRSAPKVSTTDAQDTGTDNFWLGNTCHTQEPSGLCD